MSDKSWVVYLLRCSDNSLYCGITNNLPARVDTHNAGKGSKYVRSRLPAVAVWSHPCNDRSHASKIEYRIKTISRPKKEQLVAGANLLDLIDME